MTPQGQASQRHVAGYVRLGDGGQTPHRATHNGLPTGVWQKPRPLHGDRGFFHAHPARLGVRTGSVPSDA